MKPSIVTFTGREFNYIDPKPDQIDIIDIAIALSREARFAGHCNAYYSVAQHCVLASEMIRVPDGFVAQARFAALLHDAAEAYMRDIPSPLKMLLPEYKEIEDRVLAAIYDRFHVYSFGEKLIKDAIHEVDKRLVTTEMRKFISRKAWWDTGYKAYSKEELTFEPWPSDMACVRYLARFHELQNGKM